MRPLRSANCACHALYDRQLPASIEWLECAECAHVFTSGYFGKEALTVLFSKTQNSQQPGYDIERQREVAAAMIDRVISVTGKSGGSWLDVGFGAGALLTTAAEYGFRATGLDLRPQSVEVLQKMGYDARCCSLESVKGENFDIISLCDIVEHVPFPHELISAARQRLNSGGAVLVSMPNTDSFVWRALDAVNANPYWGELEHYHNFSRSSLYRLLEQHGFGYFTYGVSRRYRSCMEVIAQVS